MLADFLEKRAITDSSLWAAWARGDVDRGSNSQSGIAVNEASTIQLLSVFSSVRLIADAIATLPIKQYRQTSLDEQPKEIPLSSWLVRPNVDTDAIAFQTQVMVSLLLRGNAYIVPLRTKVGQVAEMWAIHPDFVAVRRATANLLAPREYFVLGQPLPSGAEMVHIPGLLLPNALIGLDPITFARESFGLGLAAQTFGAKFFAQGAVPSGVITSPTTVTTQQAKELKENWLAAHGGVRNAMMPAVLTGGASYTPISLTPDQAQFLQTRQYTDEQIEKLFGMGDPFGSKHASMTYANVEQRGIDITRFTLMPWVYRMEQAFSALLPRGQFVKWDMAQLQRPDQETLVRLVASMCRNQLATPNEGRAMLGMGPTEGGDTMLPWNPVQQAGSPTVRALEEDLESR